MWRNIVLSLPAQAQDAAGAKDHRRSDVKSAVRFVGAGLLAILSITGCSSLTVVRDLNNQRFTEDARPVAHLNARVGGVYLLYFIPLVTGHADKPNRMRFFHHETDVERVVHMVTHASKELGATHLTDLYSWSDSVWPPLTLIFWYRWTSVSANASAISIDQAQSTTEPTLK